MSYGPKHPESEELFEMNFTDVLPEDVTLVSTEWSIDVLRGEATNAEDMLSGGPIVQTPSAFHKIVGGIPDTEYNVKCLGTCSDGQVIPLESTFWCRENAPVS